MRALKRLSQAIALSSVLLIASSARADVRCARAPEESDEPPMCSGHGQINTRLVADGLHHPPGPAARESA
jgi:hypothetical protein